MYICLCNRLTDRQILSQSQGSTCSVEAVYQSLGVKLKCGKCLPMAREMLEASVGTYNCTAVAAD
jgi:bacterioferritin-associated ferredoxin